MASELRAEIDPVCGMDVAPTEDACQSAYRGHDYYFCSAGCQHQFDDNPERFIQRS